ncbi:MULTISPECIES: SulP family inorganic anion transporter [unclassified Cobetia]|uniref:SulP family inorganic anion transporter n=1 Tax=unclassified Cobetia TaxID=2609414 RepID=UPI002096BB45|nr:MULTISPECIES: sulfate permease [unclassified Cobetia]MCO7233936.1 sulfate permease [Cobetia sp. Dlab-2-AX]MCO7237174.1 sulfate permease [Cobetia sp. Dlab-2-U]
MSEPVREAKGTSLGRWLPLAGWLAHYDRHSLGRDLLAAVIVSVMLVPQALAYALLAGLPAQVGLYASMLPLVLYALFGTSSTLAVGPVAIISLMTASAIAGMSGADGAALSTPEMLAAALLLAFLSGAMLIAMGLLRLGVLVNFISHPVISGFMTASGILIIASQLGPITGLSLSGGNLIAMGESLSSGAQGLHWPTLVIGLGCLAGLILARRHLKQILMALGMRESAAGMLCKTTPILAVILASLLAWGLQLGEQGMALVGSVPGGLPTLSLPSFVSHDWSGLLLSALLISVVGFVESLALAQTLAARRRQRIDPDKELIALGVSNMGAGVSGGMPISGGLSRSVVNFDAGAATPLAGAFTAIGILLASLWLTDWLAWLPRATLAAIIIVATTSLIDIAAVKRTFRYSKGDGAALMITLIITLAHGVESGIIVGIVVSLGLYLKRTSQPHSALVGRVPGSEHFRNVERHEVETDPELAILRIDESLYFANARYLEDTVLALMAERPSLKHLVLSCQAVNLIDASALESLEVINERLSAAGVQLHLSEVKGPVMDRLKCSELPANLGGDIYLSTFDAWQALSIHGSHCDQSCARDGISQTAAVG